MLTHSLRQRNPKHPRLIEETLNAEDWPRSGAVITMKGKAQDTKEGGGLWLRV